MFYNKNEFFFVQKREFYFIYKHITSSTNIDVTMTPLSFKNSLYIIKYFLELIQRQSSIDGWNTRRKNNSA